MILFYPQPQLPLSWWLKDLFQPEQQVIRDQLLRRLVGTCFSHVPDRRAMLIDKGWSTFTTTLAGRKYVAGFPVSGAVFRSRRIFNISTFFFF